MIINILASGDDAETEGEDESESEDEEDQSDKKEEKNDNQEEKEGERGEKSAAKASLKMSSLKKTKSLHKLLKQYVKHQTKLKKVCL